jgi:hypothetical protein
MKNPAVIYTAILFAASAVGAQTSPSPVSQPIQPKPAPCVPRVADPSKQIRIKPNSRWQILLEQQRAKIEKATGITLPDQSLDDLARQAQAPPPCPAPPPTTPVAVTPKQ